MGYRSYLRRFLERQIYNYLRARLEQPPDAVVLVAVLQPDEVRPCSYLKSSIQLQA